MSWFDILKKPLSLLIRDLEPDRNLLDIETKPRIFNPPGVGEERGQVGQNNK